MTTVYSSGFTCDDAGSGLIHRRLWIVALVHTSFALLDRRHTYNFPFLSLLVRIHDGDGHFVRRIRGAEQSVSVSLRESRSADWGTGDVVLAPHLGRLALGQVVSDGREHVAGTTPRLSESWSC